MSKTTTSKPGEKPFEVLHPDAREKLLMKNPQVAEAVTKLRAQYSTVVSDIMQAQNTSNWMVHQKLQTDLDATAGAEMNVTNSIEGALKSVIQPGSSKTPRAWANQIQTGIRAHGKADAVAKQGKGAEQNPYLSRFLKGSALGL